MIGQTLGTRKKHEDTTVWDEALIRAEFLVQDAKQTATGHAKPCYNRSGQLPFCEGHVMMQHLFTYPPCCLLLAAADGHV